MTMYYYGDRSCEPCRETKTILDQHRVPILFINVEGLPEYKDNTPQLLLEDGRLLIGKDEIISWIFNEWEII